MTGTFPILAAPAGEEPRVLIVDDDPTTRRMLERILKNIGVQTSSAEDGERGIRLAMEQTPDLVLLDVHLPDTDGFTVCAQLKKSPSSASTPVLFISGNDDVQAKVRGFDVGGVDYITKPLAGAEVIARVRTHLRLKRAYDTVERLQSERLSRLEATQKLIFPTPASLPGARFAVSMTQLSGAGGDFYDVIQVAERVFDYIVADASGHDVGTALWTTVLKTLVREYATSVDAPVEILRRVNASLRRILPSGQFFTVVYARLNRATGRLTVVNGGHPAAQYQRAGEPARLLRLTGDVVGAFATADFEHCEIPLAPGDRFFLYTDGLVEVGSTSEAGIARLLDSGAATRDLALDAAVEAMVKHTVDGRPAVDDVVLLGVEG
jgi:sigma-B regulation protein RsbU (phosphoserine phosphatase)